MYTEYIDSKDEWDTFWNWMMERFGEYEVIPESGELMETRPLKDFMKICIYDWYHYKRINDGEWIYK